MKTASFLTEQEIRPPEFMDLQREAALKDLGRMLSRYSEFKEVPCPACQSSSSRLKFEKHGFRYRACAQCETFYVSPRPCPQVLDWFYRDSHNYAYWNDVIFPASELVRREKIFAPRVDQLLSICEKYGVSTYSLLEVGAGFGTFCVEAKSRGIFERVIAVEPTRKLAETCRQRGLQVIEKPVEQIDFGGDYMFDVVANFEVIEHLFSPAEFVQAMAGLLRPGGILILTCPNGRGFDIEVLGSASNTVDHEHLNYFSPSSLSLLLAKQGLEVLESFTPGRLDADLVRNKALSGEFDLSNQPFLKRVLIEEWPVLGEAFQDFLCANRLSSNMWAVARKP